jgi:hypothetical protein
MLVFLVEPFWMGCLVVVEDFDFLSADFNGAGLSSDFVTLIFFDTLLSPSALLRFFVAAVVDIVAANG